MLAVYAATSSRRLQGGQHEMTALSELFLIMNM